MASQISSASPVTVGLQGDHTLSSSMKALSMILDRPQAALPHSVDGPLVWSGPKLANNRGYTFSLAAHEVAEAEKALESFKSKSSRVPAFVGSSRARSSLPVAFQTPSTVWKPCFVREDHKKKSRNAGRSPPARMQC